MSGHEYSSGAILGLGHHPEVGTMNRIKAGVFSLTRPAPSGDDDGSYLRRHLLDHMPERDRGLSRRRSTHRDDVVVRRDRGPVGIGSGAAAVCGPISHHEPMGGVAMTEILKPELDGQSLLVTG
jgi:hypothetical protein